VPRSLIKRTRARTTDRRVTGKLLTTPSRLLKLVLPLTTTDHNTDRKDVAPLALLVHPQQPLSYLERLIQAELPPLDPKDSNLKMRNVTFRAMEAKEDEIKPRKKDTPDSELGSDGSVQSYSGAGREGEGKDDGEFVRWSPSTEIGDFIRDAARAKEFEVEIEGNNEVIKIAVPSFNDRTYYLRQRLRRTAKRLSNLASIKQECDRAAHKSAQRIALGGCAGLIGYWYIVYRLTFETDLGWDVMEPVTYLVGLSTLIGGYMWFLWHNREVSYRSALNITVSARQNKLYQAKGFNIQEWETLLEDANAMRREIKAVAHEYDVEWDETKDEAGDEKVTKAMREERRNNGQTKKKKSDDDDDDDDDN
jgi:calcium uniporter protein, mitochondrial